MHSGYKNRAALATAAGGTGILPVSPCACRAPVLRCAAGESGMRGFLGLTVRDAMTQPVTTVTADTTVAELEELFERYDYNSLPVVRDGRLEGIVTKLDFLHNFIFTPDSVVPHYDALMQRRVEIIMSRDVTTVAADLPLTRVLQMMIDMKTKSFPVLDNGRLVGIISREGIIHALRRVVGRE